jgi:hypothetical protein
MTERYPSWKEMPARIFWQNVPDHLPPLAFGTKGCSAADVPKVPKAWWLSASVCSDYYF